MDLLQEKETAEAPNHHRVHSISISMPNSPREVKTPKKVLFDLDQPKFSNKVSDSSAALPPSRPKPPKSISQPIPKGTNVEDIVNGNPLFVAQHPSIARLRDDRFDNFKTFSGRLERQLTNLRGRPREPAPENEARQKQDMQSLSVDRYFDALTGPELDQVRVSICLTSIKPLSNICKYTQSKLYLIVLRKSLWLINRFIM